MGCSFPILLGKNRVEYCHRGATAVLNKPVVFGMFPMSRDLEGFEEKVEKMPRPCAVDLHVHTDFSCQRELPGHKGRGIRAR